MDFWSLYDTLSAYTVLHRNQIHVVRIGVVIKSSGAPQRA